MKNILLPTDFSENSKNAINYAHELFKNIACTFYLLNTYTPVIYNYDYQMNTGGYMGDVVDVVRKNSKQNLEELQKSLKEKYNNPNHNYELISSFSTLTDEIESCVEQHEIDLIIMGTKGASGLTEILFGSNTIHTIKKVKCPVLAIPDGFFFEKPKDILFPTDFKIDYTDLHLNVLKTIADLYKSKVHVLHVSSNRPLNETEKQNKSKLDKLLHTVNHEFNNVKDQEIPQAINEFQKLTYVHLLMMIKNKHTFLENLFFKKVIHQIGFHLTIPFLVVPSEL
ncbi:universal stress protein [Aureibaculum sp. 2210JD6-5]|uniref:universal stress protein n=1 Tax=Aureibaculum sp. 2210JD6-5 TaxID=3103957 RepID=UPI002AAE93A1|nr:universal stress protein [Aureibaculum sp. 2210JD6-5]MDY7396690.1 universal stress protein [Aureibaculum sp. 2210JD6-5]